MVWTYHIQAQSDVDRIRLLTADTREADPQLQDEEIVTFLALEGNENPITLQSTRRVLFRAASQAARAIAAQYARKATVQVGRVKEELEAVMQHYLTLASDLACRASAYGVGPRVGGMSQGQKQTSRDDLDLVQPFFTRDMMTQPGTGETNSTGSQDTAGTGL